MIIIIFQIFMGLVFLNIFSKIFTKKEKSKEVDLIKLEKELRSKNWPEELIESTIRVEQMIAFIKSQKHKNKKPHEIREMLRIKGWPDIIIDRYI